MSDSVRSHRRQPTRLRCLWDSPGKNTGVGCHFLLQCVKLKSESEVAQSCPTLRDPMDCSLPGSSAHGIFRARVLEWGALEEYNFSLQKTAVGMVGYIPMLQVHFKIRGQTQVVLGQVRSRNNRTSSPRLFLCNLWIYYFEKTLFLKKKRMIRSRE